MKKIISTEMQGLPPLHKYKWDNGLKVITCQRGQAPVACIEVWYDVGSKHEKIGKTGLAHLFEHLMFSQTANHKQGEFDRIIEKSGGDCNAATWVDWTYYRDSVPTRCIPQILDLEADRMQHLDLTEHLFKKEMDVVINERLETVEDDLDGFLDERLFKEAFNVHSYHSPTIGWMNDLKELTLDDVTSFYRQEISPARATIVIVGQFDEEKTLGSIDAAFGHIPNTSKDRPAPPQEPAQNDHREVIVEKECGSHRTLMGHKIPEQTHSSWPHLWAASSMLAGSASSRLVKKLIYQKEWASHIDCQCMPFAEPSLFMTSFTARQHASTEDIQKVVLEEFQSLASEGPKDHEFEKTLNMLKTDYWRGLQSNEQIAEMLGHFETTTGDFRRCLDLRNNLMSSRPEDIKIACKDYLLRPATTVNLIPTEGQ